jgi:2'-5' RNA ligase
MVQIGYGQNGQAIFTHASMQLSSKKCDQTKTAIPKGCPRVRELAWSVNWNQLKKEYPKRASFVYPFCMRVFLAITISEEIKLSLAAAIQRLSPLASDVKWRAKDQLHVTLAFLGEVAPAILPHITTATGRVCASVSPFACRAHGFGFFGTKRNPKTLWAGIDPAPELEDLHGRVWAELKKFGLKNDEVDFRPHVTLGHSKAFANNRAVIDAMDADEADGFGAWEVSRVTLFESRPTPRGALYCALRRFVLGAAEGAARRRR